MKSRHWFFIVIALVSTTPIFIFGQNAQPANIIVPTYRPAAVVSVNEKGQVSIKNAVVFFVGGKALYVRTYWEDSYVRWTIRVSDKTDLIKKFGGQTDFASIKIGDIVDVGGPLIAGSDTLSIDSTMIRDLSQETEKVGFSGKVSRANDGSGTFVIKTDSGKQITVKVVSTTVIKKGAIFIPLSKIVYGDLINFVDGTYHEPTKTITANNIDVYQTKKIFEPRNFQGTLKSLSGTALPVSMVVAVGDTDYTFHLNEQATVLTAKKISTKLQRFVIGDTVRLYGKIREANLTEVDASILRNLDL